MPVPKIGAELGPARGNITRGTRGRDAESLRRGAGRYVTASGGAAGAARRMSTSRRVAAGIVQVAQAFNAGGAANVLQTFNLQGLAGATITEVFVALTDVLCPAGGTIDEAIARDAMLETVVDLLESGVTDFDDLTPEQLQEFFIGVVGRSIEDKIWNELGTNSFGRAEDIETIERAEANLHDFVDGCVRDQFDNGNTSLSDIGADEIDGFVSGLYTAAFEMMRILGESE
ncbi:Qat anti-phage system associated protein QatB [Thalassospira sp. A3_1]|uniref:Qat anti-phage system associated protein QatB n=1 Tax=Thalassospira sp. A3_1 TaxID=2821088 RepID=UPI0032AE9996